MQIRRQMAKNYDKTARARIFGNGDLKNKS
jgi:hypothetical protein